MHLPSINKMYSDRVKKFYNINPFPGTYTTEQLHRSGYPSSNKYLRVIDQWLPAEGKSVLDVGCGTGLITNLFATKTKNNFVGLDFSNGIKYANQYSNDCHLDNVKFVQGDFFDFPSDTKYDIIIAQSFLTHVPDSDAAVSKMKSLLNDDGILIVGVYNKWGKILKKYFNINYHNSRLRLDQECNPYEVSFTHKHMMDMFSDMQLLQISPSIGGKFVALTSLLNSINGGLTMYVLKKV